MALPTDTFTTYSAIGNREDLSNFIYNVAPTETPFQSRAKRTKATNTLHEWQTDTLAAAATNAQLQGDDAVTTAVVPTVRLNNRTQISTKAPRVTGTQQAMDPAGRGDELDYQVVKMGTELKRDMELMFFDNVAKVTGDATTAPRMAGIPTWIATNDSFGAGGASPTGDGSNTRTNGTQRAFTETLLLDAHQLVWEASGESEQLILFVGSFNKRVASGFTGVATKFKDVEDKKIIASADIYVSDFGEINIVPNRFMRSRDALLLNMKFWAIADLRPMTSEDLAKTGDSERKFLLAEYTLESRNQAASGGVYDLTTS